MWIVNGKSGATDRRRAGQVAEKSGLYMFTHSSHRLSHFVMAFAGDAFPRCRRCGESVQFTLYRAADHITNDRDLALSKPSGSKHRIA